MRDSQNKCLYCSITGKVCYTAREAGIVINSAHRRRYGDRSKWRNEIPRRKYYCHGCGFYHVTHYAVYHADKKRQKKKLG